MSINALSRSLIPSKELPGSWRRPPGYTADRHRIQLGRGEAVFIRALEALRRWKMFDIGWIWPAARA